MRLQVAADRVLLERYLDASVDLFFGTGDCKTPSLLDMVTYFADLICTNLAGVLQTGAAILVLPSEDKIGW